MVSLRVDSGCLDALSFGFEFNPVVDSADTDNTCGVSIRGVPVCQDLLSTTDALRRGNFDVRVTASLDGVDNCAPEGTSISGLSLGDGSPTGDSFKGVSGGIGSWVAPSR